MKNGSGVSIVTDKIKKITASLQALTQSKVMVGVPSKTAQRKDDPINNATIGYIQEHGSPAQNIPARPFLIPGVKNAQDKTIAIFKSGTLSLLEGDMGGFNKSLNAAGINAVSAVQAKITNGPFAPLAASTIAARERRGRKGVNPLIDTGQLRRSISYIIRKV